MASEVGPIYVDSLTVTAAGTAEALTARSIECTSVFLKPLVGNTDAVYVVDSATETKKFEVLSSGLTLTVTHPKFVKIDVEVSGEGVEWVAV
jgi:hypothetical protein